jgi:uncharacterized protein DUF6627
MPRIHRLIARILVACVCTAGLPIRTAHAELIGTDSIGTALPAWSPAREFLGSLLDRADVRAALEKQGVSPEYAKARVAALSDDEVERLAAKFDSLPAGGGGFETVIVLAVVVFLVLLLTDILGFTKVFPFTRPAK